MYQCREDWSMSVVGTSGRLYFVARDTGGTNTLAARDQLRQKVGNKKAASAEDWRA